MRRAGVPPIRRDVEQEHSALTHITTSDSPSPGERTGLLVVLNRDLFFGVSIGNTLRALGYAVAFVQTTEALVDHLRGPEPVALGIIDMSAGVEWDRIRSARDAGLATPLLAFGSHLDVEGRRAAKAAGVTRVVSNGDFHRDMVHLVRRYAVSPAPAPSGERDPAATQPMNPSSDTQSVE
jgi:hypothetical protein